MDIKWYYHRLCSMPFEEVIFRIRKSAYFKYANLTKELKKNRYQKKATGSLFSDSSLQEINFYGLSEFNRQTYSPSWEKATIDQAEKFLSGKYDCISEKNIEVSDPFLWNYEPKNKIVLPNYSSLKIDYRDTEKCGDFKYFWEFGRWGHLVTLAKAYLLTDDKRYAKVVEAQICGFLEQCPYLRGVHWTMAMENSLRLISLCWVVKLLWKYLQQNQKFCCIIEEIIFSHLDYITNNYSLYSSGNNHYIGELCGVFITGVCFGDDKRIRKHRDDAYRRLNIEIGRQFYKDGVNKEQASHYHLSCIYCFLLAGLLGKNNGMPFPDNYWKYIEKAAEYTGAIMNDQQCIPQIGDSDDGETVHLSDTDVSLCESFLATCSVIFDRADFKAKTDAFDEISFLLLGEKGKEKYDKLSGEKSKWRKVVFKEGGYYIIDNKKSVSVKMIIDCGPLGVDPLAAHGHADALSFQLDVNGREFFIDPGTYIYHADNPYRNYFRKTIAHNTICIDGKDQAEIRGPFLWEKNYNSTLEKWLDDHLCVHFIGYHDGYQRLSDPVLHKREIYFNKQNSDINITDDIKCLGEHNVQICFHLSELCHIEELDSAFKITNNGQSLLLTFESDLDLSIYCGEENPIIGWRSKFYDQKYPINTILAGKTINGNSKFCTRIEMI